MKRILVTLIALLMVVSAAMAQSVAFPEPGPIPDQPSLEELRAALLEVQGSLCHSIAYAAKILTQTGTLASAIPIVVESTGLQPGDIEQKEAAVCRSDTSGLTPVQLRANNRTAVWLLEIHMAAMSEVLPAQ